MTPLTRQAASAVRLLTSLGASSAFGRARLRRACGEGDQ